MFGGEKIRNDYRGEMTFEGSLVRKQGSSGREGRNFQKSKKYDDSQRKSVSLG